MKLKIQSWINVLSFAWWALIVQAQWKYFFWKNCKGAYYCFPELSGVYSLRSWGSHLQQDLTAKMKDCNEKYHKKLFTYEVYLQRHTSGEQSTECIRRGLWNKKELVLMWNNIQLQSIERNTRGLASFTGQPKPNIFTCPSGMLLTTNSIHLYSRVVISPCLRLVRQKRRSD